MPIALTIAGSDSSGGAGIQADLKTFAALGVYGTSALTAVTAQNTRGVTAVFPLPVDVVTAQIEAVAGDFKVAAAKTGMLATAAIVEAVAAAIDALEIPLVVVDPVMVAKSGDRLLDAAALGALKGELIRRAHLVAPNADEAAILAEMPVRTVDHARAACRRIHDLGPAAVIVKGGHLEADEAVDVLYDGRDIIELRSARIDTPHTHGTGCTFTAAVTGHLALGAPLRQAVELAKAYVTGAIRHGLALGHGHGPLDHFWDRPGRRG